MRDREAAKRRLAQRGLRGAQACAHLRANMLSCFTCTLTSTAVVCACRTFAELKHLRGCTGRSAASCGTAARDAAPRVSDDVDLQCTARTQVVTAIRQIVRVAEQQSVLDSVDGSQIVAGHFR